MSNNEINPLYLKCLLGEKSDEKMSNMLVLVMSILMSNEELRRVFIE